MENQSYPPDHSRVLFTDASGVQRNGKYVRDLHGYVENVDNEMLLDDQYVYLEGDIEKWEYAEEKDKPNSDFMIIL